MYGGRKIEKYHPNSAEQETEFTKLQGCICDVVMKQEIQIFFFMPSSGTKLLTLL